MLICTLGVKLEFKMCKRNKNKIVPHQIWMKLDDFLFHIIYYCGILFMTECCKRL